MAVHQLKRICFCFVFSVAVIFLSHLCAFLLLLLCVCGAFNHRIGRNYRIGPYFSVFVFVLSSFFLLFFIFSSLFNVLIIMYWKTMGRFGPIPVRSGRFGFKGGSFQTEFRGKSFRPGVFIWGMELRYRVELTLILL